MPRSSQAPEPWHSFLGELDQEATEETRLDCMGGFVVTLLYGLSRATSDLDVLLIAPREQRTPLLELGVRGKRTSLAARKSGTRGLNSETMDRNDRGGERRESGPRQTMKDLLRPPIRR